MPRKFFLFPSKDKPRHDPKPPKPAPVVPPKPYVSKPTPLESWKETLRSRRITSPNLSASASGNGPGPQAAYPPHRVSASDSMAQGAKWRGIFPNAEQLRRESRKSTTSRNSNANSNTNLSTNGDEPGGLSPPPLRRAKPHHVIEEERQRRANAENLLNEQSKLKEEIDQDTVRLSKIQQKRQAIQEERERVEKEKERLAHEAAANPGNMNANVNTTADPNIHTNKMNMNGYGKSQSAPSLPNWSSYTPYPSYAAYTSAHSPPSASRNQSRESFQTNSTQEPDFRRVHSRTPSASSNDRSPPPAPHWQRVEQARKERERERMMSKLAEAREREKEAFAVAWAIYESRWRLLMFAISASSVPSYAQQAQRPKSMQSMQPMNLGSPPTSGLSLSFTDIPWPLLHPPRTCDDITTIAIRKFLASDYHGIDKSHRERIKEALLRWHPDRFGSRILDYVRPEERDKVNQGVDIVVRCLNELLSKH